MIALFSLLLLFAPDPDPFEVEDFFEALDSRDISIVNRSDTERRNGADACTSIVTARAARFVTCVHSTVADARRVAYGRSDYTRTVFQRGTVVVYLRKGASLRLLDSMIDVMGRS